MMDGKFKNRELVLALNDLALRGGAVALRYYGCAPGVRLKPDHTLVSAADTEIEDLIRAGLQQLLPEADFIGEEEQSRLMGSGGPRLKKFETSPKPFLWAVDPIDGTANFLSHYGDFAISIGLLKRHGPGYAPVLGAIYLPVRDQLYFTNGAASYRTSEARSARKSTVELTEKVYPPQVDLTRSLFALNENDLGKIVCPGGTGLRVPGCTVAQFVAVVDGEVIGTLTTAHIWDVAAALAIGKPLGLRMYALDSGDEKKLFTLDRSGVRTRRGDWHLANGYLVCHKSTKRALTQAVRIKQPISASF